VENRENMKKEKEVMYKHNVVYVFVLLMVGLIFVGAVPVSAEEGTTIFEDDFSALNLDNWSPFGSPSPRVLASVEGRSGVFDNNGDSWCNSGVVSKDTFSFPNGLTMESDIYVKVTNMAGCWDDAVIGLTKETRLIGMNLIVPAKVTTRDSLLAYFILEMPAGQLLQKRDGTLTLG